MAETTLKLTRCRARRSVNRVRTGCTTCKIRRVKCDETKPACKRCTSTGRKCDGYDIPKQLLFEICTDPAEKWSFSYYRDRTIKHIVSFQEYDFFDRLVLQASHTQDIVRRMVIAIGAYHECVDTPVWPRSVELFAFACTQYHKALARLRQRAPAMSAEEILFCCVLFTYFENIRGDVNASLRHLHAANTLIKEEKQRRPSVSTKTTLLDTMLAPIFEELNLAATTNTPVIRRLEPDCRIPEFFETLGQAHTALVWTAKQITAHLDYALQEQDWEAKEHLTRDLLNRWETAWRRFRAANPPACLPEAVYTLGTHHIELLFLYLSIRLNAALDPTEMIYDNYLDMFSRIIQICLAMIFIFSTSTYGDQRLKDKLGFIPRYVTPLSYVGQRCRDPHIRRQVLGVLRSAHKVEGQWDSFVAADVCEFVMGLEEAMVSCPVKNCSDIPEHVRQQVVAANLFDFDPVDQKIKITRNFSNPGLIKLRSIRTTGEYRPYFEVHWLDRRKPFTALDNGPKRKSAATTDPPGPIPKLDPQPICSRLHPPATPAALLKSSDPLTLFPDDIPGVFPQLQELPSNMWDSYAKTSDPVLFIKRLGLNQVYVPNITDGDSARKRGVRFETMGIKTAQMRHFNVVTGDCLVSLG